MRLAISSIVFVAAFALVGCEKKVEAPAVADASVEKPACCETAPAVDADAAAPVAPLTATATVQPVTNPVASTATAPVAAPAVAPPTPVTAPTTTIKK